LRFRALQSHAGLFPAVLERVFTMALSHPILLPIKELRLGVRRLSLSLVTTLLIPGTPAGVTLTARIRLAGRDRREFFA